MAKLKFLITGSTGDTGGAATRQLLARGHSVRALAHSDDDRAKQLKALGAEVVFGDFLDLSAMRSALRDTQRPSITRTASSREQMI